MIPKVNSHSESDLQKKGKCLLLLFLAVIICDCSCRSSNFRQIETATNQKPIDCEKQQLLTCDVQDRCVIHFLLLSLSYSFLKRTPCFIHCEEKAAKGGGVLMSIMIPSCNAHAYMKFSKKNFAPYAKNATVKNIITINKYNVGMKSLDRAIIVSDTLKTETSPSFIS